MIYRLNKSYCSHFELNINLKMNYDVFKRKKYVTQLCCILQKVCTTC